MTDEELREIAESALGKGYDSPYSVDFARTFRPDVVLGLLDRAANAEKDFRDAMELVRQYSAERDEAREAVRRLVEVLKFTNVCWPPVSEALADPIVKRIVEGK